MALQIRRGTQAELTTFVPAEGEPVYTTDSKRLYVGDGITPGGIDISVVGGIGGPLSSNLVLNNNDIVGSGNISIIGLIKADGLFEGDLFGNVTGSVYANSSTVLVDAENALIPAEVVQGTFTGVLSGDIISPIDETLILDAANSTFYGSVVGNVTGSVFGDDLSPIIDSTSKKITVNEGEIGQLSVASLNGNIDQFSANGVEIRFNDDVQERLTIYSTTGGDYGESGIIQLRSFKGTLDNQINTSPDDILGGIQITGFTNNEYKTATAMISSWDASADPTLDFPASNLEIFIGNNTSDEQPWIFKFTHKGTFEAPVIKAQSYITAELPGSPEAGWIVFDSSIQKFKGYVDDTGLASGGASNSTPGWVNLN